MNAARGPGEAPAADVAAGPVLALDSSGDVATAALWLPGDGLDLREESAAPGSRASAVLHVLVERLLAAAGLEAEDLALVAAVRGPGSFTGVRVSLAAASGIALAAGVPTASVTSSQALALASGLPGSHVVVLDGGQGRVFVAREEVSGRVVRTQADPADASIEDACAAVASASGASCLLRGRPPRAAELLAAGCKPFDGALAGACALLAASGQASATLAPHYGRPPAIRPAAPLAHRGDGSARP